MRPGFPVIRRVVDRFVVRPLCVLDEISVGAQGQPFRPSIRQWNSMRVAHGLEDFVESRVDPEAVITEIALERQRSNARHPLL